MTHNLDYFLPNLNFEKFDGKYIFHSVEGMFYYSDLNNECRIFDIDIGIDNDIFLSFDIDYDNLIQFKENEFDKSKPFPRYSSSKINCSCQDYNLSFLNFYETSSNSLDSISGYSYEVIIRKGSEFEEGSDIKVWEILETDSILQSNFKEINFKNLPNVYLKSVMNLDELGSQHTNIEQISFNQLLDNSTFLFYKTTYGEKSIETIEIINQLLKFFDSNIVHLRMKIIQEISTNNLEIRISSKNTTNLKGKSIFCKSESNFHKFLTSSYKGYLESKKQVINVNIDLLLHYYVQIKNEFNPVTKIILCSEFMEIYKNSFSNESKNETFKIYNRLQKHRFNQLKLDSINLLKFLQPDIFLTFEDVKNNLNYKNNQYFSKVCDKFEETYIAAIIHFHRNKIIHSGKFILNKEHIDSFMKWWLQKLKHDYKNEFINVPEKLIDNTADSIKEKLKSIESLFDVDVQSRFMEYFIEIILLMMLDVDCELINEDRFKTTSGRNVTYSSKDYIKKFKK